MLGITLGAAGVGVWTLDVAMRIGCTLGGAHVMGRAAGMMRGGTLGGVTAGVGCGNGSVDCVCLCVCSDLVLASVAPVVREKISAKCRSACICVCAMGGKWGCRVWV